MAAAPVNIATWNVNSLRARIPRVQAFLERHNPDVLCLQETKVENGLFPRLAFTEHHIEAHGQKTYNGVAVISRERPDEVRRGFAGDPAADQHRVMACRFGDLWVYNLYVVNGKSVDNPAYDTKLRWLEALRDHIAAEHDPQDQVLLVGDFNVTPDDLDVHDPERWRGHILCSEPERERLRALMDWGLCDLHRPFAPDGGVFTWWDYRQGAFARGWGLRIDLALGTAPVAVRCSGVAVDRDERKKGDTGVAPSDHAPVIVTLD